MSTNDAFSWANTRIKPFLVRLADRVDFADPPQRNARITAAAVFGGLYLAVGVGLEVWWNGYGLLWPFTFWSLIPWTVLMVLGGFAVVALYAYRLKLRLLTGGVGAQEQLARCNEALRVAMQERKEAQIKALAERANAQGARERERAANERAEAAEARARQAEAQARAAGAHRTADSGPPPSGKDSKFDRARRTFARLYHPDNVTTDGLDKVIRNEIFKEFWREFEKIEKSAKG